MKHIRIEISPSFAGEEIYDISEDRDSSSNSRNYCLSYTLPWKECIAPSASGSLIISESKVDRLFEQFKNVNIGIIPNPVFGLDGTTTRVTITHGLNEINLEWWENAPDQWRPVNKLIRKVRALAKHAGREEGSGS